MPNGNLGERLGTESSPFEIWDVHDLNALRGLPNSETNRIFIRFKADIDFRTTPFADLASVNLMVYPLLLLIACLLLHQIIFSLL